MPPPATGKGRPRATAPASYVMLPCVSVVGESAFNQVDFWSVQHGLRWCQVRHLRHKLLRLSDLHVLHGVGHLQRARFVCRLRLSCMIPLGAESLTALRLHLPLWQARATRKAPACARLNTPARSEPHFRGCFSAIRLALLTIVCDRIPRCSCDQCNGLTYFDYPVTPSIHPLLHCGCSPSNYCEALC